MGENLKETGRDFNKRNERNFLLFKLEKLKLQKCQN